MLYKKGLSVKNGFTTNVGGSIKNQKNDTIKKSKPLNPDYTFKGLIIFLSPRKDLT